MAEAETASTAKKVLNANAAPAASDASDAQIEVNVPAPVQEAAAPVEAPAPAPAPAPAASPLAEAVADATEAVVNAVKNATEAVVDTVTPSENSKSLEDLGFDPAPAAAAAPAPAAPAAPAPAPAKVKAPPRPRAIAIPKDSASFFRARKKDIKLFQFNADGNLAVPSIRGEPAKVIELPFYRPATADELRVKEEKAKDEITAVEVEFDEKAKLLREAIDVWRTTGASSGAIKYQNELTRLDAQRTMLRSPLRWIKTYKRISQNKIILDNPYEIRKFKYPIDALTLRSARFEDVVVVGKKEDVLAAPAPAPEEAEDESFVVFFDPTDAEHGLLSPDTTVDFVYNSTKYTNLQQAYEVERATLLGRKDLRPLLLRAATAKQARVRGAGIVGKIENPRELWINILKAAIAQDARFAPVLRSTGTDTIVYANPRDNLLGVGLSAEDPNILERSSWTGENILGQAWQAVRASLPAEGEAVLQGGASAYTDHGRTLREKAAERASVFRGGLYRRAA